MSVEELQRLLPSAPTPRARAVRMTTYAAGLRVGAVVRRHLTDLDSERLVVRVHLGKGHTDRSTLLSARLLAARRASWTRSRPAPWLFPGKDAPQPMPIATAQQRSSHAQRAAGITQGTGIQTLRHCCAPHVLEAGVDLRTIHLLLGHRSIDTTTRSLHITRQHLVTGHRPCALLWRDPVAPDGVTSCLRTRPTRRSSSAAVSTSEASSGASRSCRPGSRPWGPTPPRCFFFPVHAFGTVCRGTCLAALHANTTLGPLVFPEQTEPLATPEGFRRFTDRLYAKAWIVYAKQSLAGPGHVLDSLSRSTHRVAIATHRIVNVQEGQGPFPSRNRRQGNRVQTMTLDAPECIRRFLLPVVPRGLQRLRPSGLLANRCKARAKGSLLRRGGGSRRGAEYR